MSKKHNDLYNLAEDAITDLFSDVSVSRQKTMESLQNLMVDIENKIFCIKSDIRRSA